MKVAGVQYTQPILVKLKTDVQSSQVDVPSVDQLYTPKSTRTKAAERSSALRQISLPARGKQPAEVKQERTLSSGNDCCFRTAQVAKSGIRENC